MNHRLRTYALAIGGLVLAVALAQAALNWIVSPPVEKAPEVQAKLPVSEADAGPTVQSASIGQEPPSAGQRPRLGVGTGARDPRIGMGEGGNMPARFLETGAGLQRFTFSWSAIQPNGSQSFQPDLYLPPQRLEAALAGGAELLGVVQFTPDWAARNPRAAERSVPERLGDMDGPWASFMRRLASHYRGRIKNWAIWNEMEFRPGDAGAGESWTWEGGEREYWYLLRDAYRAIKAVDKDTRVIFGPTSYWVDAINGREQFVRRVFGLVEGDQVLAQEARANDWFHDAISMNIYRAPDDVRRISLGLRNTQRQFGLEKQQWLLETNCMPWDDPRTPKVDDQQRCTLEEQAAFVPQAFAMGFASAWDRQVWYQLTDNEIWQQQEVWGLLRDDGSERPAFRAYQTMAQALSFADRYTFLPLARAESLWAPNPFYPNWLVYQVVAEQGSRRVHVVWTSAGQDEVEGKGVRHADGRWHLRVHLPKQGDSAAVYDKAGNPAPLVDWGGSYVLHLSAATAQGPLDPDAYFYVGGDPVYLVQTGVPPGSPLSEPALGEPPG